MATVIGFEEPPKEEPKVATCPMCKAIIEYTNNDVGFFQTQGAFITCPNCKRRFLL